MKTENVEEKRHRANERKLSLEQQANIIKIKLERDHSNAEQKRSSHIDDKLKKLSDHHNKVAETRTRLSTETQKKIETQKERLEQRLNAAQAKREMRLEQVKNVAQLSAKKKAHLLDSNNASAAPALISVV